MFTQEQKVIIDEMIFITRFRFNLVYGARLSQVEHRNQLNGSGKQLQWPDQSLFYLAVKLNFTETAIRLEKLGCDLKEQDVNRFSVLQWAVINGNLDCVKLILNNKKVNSKLPRFLDELILGFKRAEQLKHHHIAQFINSKIITLGVKSLIANPQPPANVKNISKYSKVMLAFQDRFNHPEIKDTIQKLILLEKSYIEYFALNNDQSQKIIQSKVYKLLQTFQNLEAPTCAPQLFIGEADYSGAKAMVNSHIRSHSTMASTITATEYMSEAEAKRAYEKLEGNVQELRAAGATVLFGVDARSLHANSAFSGKRFPRIHFNCPHDRMPMHARTLPTLIHDFFKSARFLQRNGDKIYIALPKLAKTSDNHFRLSYIYDIYNASAKAGYQFFKKRHFGSERYPGYEHRITGKDQSVHYTDFREYIFKQTNLSYEEIVKLTPSIKYYAYNQMRDALPDINTDNDSSDYMEIEPPLKKHHSMQTDQNVIVSPPQSPLHDFSSTHNVESIIQSQLQTNPVEVEHFNNKKSFQSVFNPPKASFKENQKPNSGEIVLSYSSKPVSESNPTSEIKLTHQFLGKLHGQPVVNQKPATPISNNVNIDNRDEMCVEDNSSPLQFNH